MSKCCTLKGEQPLHSQGQVDTSGNPEQITATSHGEANRCSSCGQKGRDVDTATVKAMLAISLHAIQPTHEYHFCQTADCPVVYFANGGEQQFHEDALREQVHQKHPANDAVFVCYCFRHTAGSIRAELLESGQSTVIERVTAGTKAGECACEIRNPQGSCCLGNVGAMVRRLEAELAAVEQRHE